MWIIKDCKYKVIKYTCSAYVHFNTDTDMDTFEVLDEWVARLKTIIPHSGRDWEVIAEWKAKSKEDAQEQLKVHLEKLKNKEHNITRLYRNYAEYCDTIEWLEELPVEMWVK